MVDWFANEGTPHDLNNPLNLQTPFGGSVVSTAGGSPAGDRIQAYPTPDDFVAAFPIEMNSGSYSAIVAALKAGKGLEGSASLIPNLPPSCLSIPAEVTIVFQRFMTSKVSLLQLFPDQYHTGC